MVNTIGNHDQILSVAVSPIRFPGVINLINATGGIIVPLLIGEDAMKIALRKLNTAHLL